MAVTVDKSSPLYDFWDGGEYDPDATPVRLPLTCPSCICPEEDQEGANNHERGGVLWHGINAILKLGGMC